MLETVSTCVKKYSQTGEEPRVSWWRQRCRCLGRQWWDPPWWILVAPGVSPLVVALCGSSWLLEAPCGCWYPPLVAHVGSLMPLLCYSTATLLPLYCHFHATPLQRDCPYIATLRPLYCATLLPLYLPLYCATPLLSRGR